MAIIITKDGKDAEKIEKSDFEKEGYLQNYIHENPDSIPVYEIEEDKKLFVVAREFSTESGPIDALAIDKDGDLYVVETKLYKNPDKRTVVAQALDYGASLWRHSDYNEFISKINAEINNKFKISFEEKTKDFFNIDEEQVSILLEAIKRNLQKGNIKFVILMDAIDDRLKDLIVYINQNSQFDIYAVQMEYYKFEKYEIMIPKLFGVEVKKDIKTGGTGQQWNWETFKQKLKNFGEEEVIAAEQIIEWAGKNDIEIEWSNSQRGGFFLCYYPDGKKGFYPFGVTGDATISWNAPHARDKSPQPFDKIEKRADILKRLRLVKGASVDLDNVDGYKGLRLPLRVIANEDARREFFAVLLWIKKTLETE